MLADRVMYPFWLTSSFDLKINKDIVSKSQSLTYWLEEGTGFKDVLRNEFRCDLALQKKVRIVSDQKPEGIHILRSR